jgi:glucuronosyltransferase
MGAILHYSDISESTVFEALQKVLTPTAQENAQQVSQAFRNRLVDPLESAIWWIEFVANKNSGKLLKSQSVELNWFNYHSLDAISILLCAMAVIIYLIVRVIRFVAGGIVQSFNSKEQSSKKRD